MALPGCGLPVKLNGAGCKPKLSRVRYSTVVCGVRRRVNVDFVAPVRIPINNFFFQGYFNIFYGLVFDKIWLTYGQCYFYRFVLLMNSDLDRVSRILKG